MSDQEPSAVGFGLDAGRYETRVLPGDAEVHLNPYWLVEPVYARRRGRLGLPVWECCIENRYVGLGRTRKRALAAAEEQRRQMRTPNWSIKQHPDCSVTLYLGGERLLSVFTGFPARIVRHDRGNDPEFDVELVPRRESGW